MAGLCKSISQSVEKAIALKFASQPQEVSQRYSAPRRLREQFLSPVADSLTLARQISAKRSARYASRGLRHVGSSQCQDDVLRTGTDNVLRTVRTAHLFGRASPGLRRLATRALSLSHFDATKWRLHVKLSVRLILAFFTFAILAASFFRHLDSLTFSSPSFARDWLLLVSAVRA